ncbi:MAG: putative pyridoxal phosphate-dependent enzyme apparently involved in regulation of cell wall [Chthonomonadaceae bacterium]|nr:putative pyridoxal phosphate-dependent enzyme apparently involved in regulation of cell wall [Chthonomonadaceae bacterium]
MSGRQKLAIEGGTPVRDIACAPWPVWPVYDVTEERALLDVLHSGKWWGVEGDQGKRFEREFAAYQHAHYGLVCTNGTAALEIAFRALDIGCGDEVIVPPYTFIATASAALAVGATPVFVDILPDTLNIDPAQIEAAVTPRTRAILPVHIAGRPADMDAVLAIAARHRLAVIEDAAQAHGAEWRGTRIGALGDFGTFSFQASKNLNSGEGGMILTNKEALADAAWSVINVGRARGGHRYAHQVLGGNFRMTEFQSAVLRTQLRRLPEQTARRTANARYLCELLSEIPGISVPFDDPRITVHAYHLFTFRVDLDRLQGRTYPDFIKALRAEGIPCSDGYVPLYREGLFTRKSRKEVQWCQASRAIDYTALHLPVCEQVCSDTIWLPQTLLLADHSDMEDVATAITKILT